MQRTIDFKVKDNAYQLTVPTIGEVMAIESTKMRLTGKEYGSIILSGTVVGFNVLDYVDMIAVLSVLCSNLIKDTKADRIEELSLEHAKELLVAYATQVKPWVMEWEQLLRLPKEDGK